MDIETGHPLLSTSERLPVLDGLRALAAIGVILFHAPALRSYVPFFDRTYLLVDVFFLLSGFVLTLSAEPRLHRSLDAVTFAYRRFLRFWPIMAIGSCLGVLTFMDHVPVAQLTLLLPLALLMIPYPNNSGAPIFPLNGPQWSLFWELVANFAHGLLLKRLSDCALLLLACACGLGLAIASFVHGACDFGAVGSSWWLASLRIGWSYSLGCWFARGWRRQRPVTCMPWWMAMGLPVLLTCVLPMLPIAKGIADAVVVVLVYPFCFRLAVAAPPPRLMAKSLERLGALSFPLYAVHLPIMMAFRLRGDTVVMEVTAISITTVLAIFIAHLDVTRRRQGWTGNYSMA